MDSASELFIKSRHTYNHMHASCVLISLPQIINPTSQSDRRATSTLGGELKIIHGNQPLVALPNLAKSFPIGEPNHNQLNWHKNLRNETGPAGKAA